MDAPAPDLARTRGSLQLVATHVLARGRREATGRFGLRVVPGGIATPEYGPDARRLRVTATHLVREHAGPDGSATAATPLDGSSLADLAAFAGVDLAAPLDVGHDTPEQGDPAAPLVVTPSAAADLLGWFELGSVALDDVLADHGAGAPVMAQLWPEHFDLGTSVDAAPGRRANLGASPGDGFHDEPYLYIGPWTDDRPGDASYWNAPFGAVLGRGAVLAAPDPRRAAGDFLRRGLALLAG